MEKLLYLYDFIVVGGLFIVGFVEHATNSGYYLPRRTNSTVNENYTYANHSIRTSPEYELPVVMALKEKNRSKPTSFPSGSSVFGSVYDSKIQSNILKTSSSTTKRIVNLIPVEISVANTQILSSAFQGFLVPVANMSRLYIITRKEIHATSSQNIQKTFANTKIVDKENLEAFTKKESQSSSIQIIIQGTSVPTKIDNKKKLDTISENKIYITPALPIQKNKLLANISIRNISPDILYVTNTTQYKSPKISSTVASKDKSLSTEKIPKHFIKSSSSNKNLIIIKETDVVKTERQRNLTHSKEFPIIHPSMSNTTSFVGQKATNSLKHAPSLVQNISKRNNLGTTFKSNIIIDDLSVKGTAATANLIRFNTEFFVIPSQISYTRTLPWMDFISKIRSNRTFNSIPLSITTFYREISYSKSDRDKRFKSISLKYSQSTANSTPYKRKKLNSILPTPTSTQRILNSESPISVGKETLFRTNYPITHTFTGSFTSRTTYPPHRDKRNISALISRLRNYTSGNNDTLWQKIFPSKSVFITNKSLFSELLLNRNLSETIINRNDKKMNSIRFLKLFLKYFKKRRKREKEQSRNHPPDKELYG